MRAAARNKPRSEEKIAITTACESLIADVLLPKYLPEITPSEFNYPIAIYGKWHGNKYRLVRGLFPVAEQQVLLDMLARSLVFPSPNTIETVQNKGGSSDGLGSGEHVPAQRWRKTFSGRCAHAVGMSVGTACFVSMDYFRINHRFVDFVVHEAAHVFHNCERRTLGLPETRRHEWLLEIDFGKRETFACACEAYSRILELGDSARARCKL